MRGDTVVTVNHVSVTVSHDTNAATTTETTSSISSDSTSSTSTSTSAQSSTSTSTPPTTTPSESTSSTTSSSSVTLPEAFLGMHVVTKSAYLKKHPNSIHHPSTSTPSQSHTKPMKYHLRDPNNWRLDASPESIAAYQHHLQQQQTTTYEYINGHEMNEMSAQMMSMMQSTSDTTNEEPFQPVQHEKKKKNRKHKQSTEPVVTVTTEGTNEPMRERPRFASATRSPSANTNAGLTRASGRYAIGPDDPSSKGFGAGRGKARLSVTSSPALGSAAATPQKPMPPISEAAKQDA